MSVDSDIRKRVWGKFVGNAIVSDGTSDVGRSTVYIECVCGAEDEYYVWSMAGHGFAFCKGCRRAIHYGWGWNIYERPGESYAPLRGMR